jgi:hypothetical protein
MDFYPVITEDGSCSLYNTKINDIYHSKIGAYTEALNKYVYPSGVLDFSIKNGNVQILDVCFGMGYNSIVAASKILELNNKTTVYITGIEIDPYVIAYSYFIDYKDCNKSLIKGYKRMLFSNPSIRRLIRKISKDVMFLSISRYKNTPSKWVGKKSGVKYFMVIENNSILHNIYYRSVSNRNRLSRVIRYNDHLVNIALYIDDARITLNELKSPFDYIFHDPFTPSKLPSLWSVNIFMKLFPILKANGNITTYSSSAPVRSGLIEAGFYIGASTPIGRKCSGTIAYKLIGNITCPLSTNELGILKTKSGIPYYDASFNLSNEEILNNRAFMVNDSDRITASQYYKQNKRDQI